MRSFVFEVLREAAVGTVLFLAVCGAVAVDAYGVMIIIAAVIVSATCTVLLWRTIGSLRRRLIESK